MHALYPRHPLSGIAASTSAQLRTPSAHTTRTSCAMKNARCVCACISVCISVCVRISPPSTAAGAGGSGDAKSGAGGAGGAGVAEFTAAAAATTAATAASGPKPELGMVAGTGIEPDTGTEADAAAAAADDNEPTPEAKAANGTANGPPRPRPPQRCTPPLTRPQRRRPARSTASEVPRRVGPQPGAGPAQRGGRQARCSESLE